MWPDAQGRTSWLGRFLDYLRAHGRLQDLAFMSFEHYPVRRMRNAVGEPLSGAGTDYSHHESLAGRRIAAGHSSARHRNQCSRRRSLRRHFRRALAGRFLRRISERGRPVHALLSRPVLLSAASGVSPTVGEPTTCSWWTIITKSSSPLSQFFAAQLITQEWARTERCRAPAISRFERREGFRRGTCW